MRFLFSSTRGAGHLQPLLPYAQALLAHGHEVLVAAPAEVSETLREAKLSHAPFGHPGDDVLAPIWARFRQAPAAEITAIALGEIFAGLNAQAALPKLTETISAWRPDLVVRESAEFAAAVAADRAGVAHARVAVHMVSFEEAFAALVAEPLDKLRHDVGLPPDQAAFLTTEAVFTAFPASLDEPLDGRAPMPVPFRLRFIEEEPRDAPTPWAKAGDARPLVYITFGTIAGSSPSIRSIYRTALEAIASLPVRALLTTGRGMEAGVLGAIPANVHVEEWVPQREVLPRAAALVCHGGSGTVRGALAAGVPMVVAPLGADQPHNARRVAAVGAGIALPDPDAASLRAAIERVLAEADFGRGARQIADEIAALPLVDTAVTALVAMASA
ncbi:MAG TPA: glycosyltransferase [Polyangia bacterium]|jgi:UDP:flavonoid glycosyltransferase YjiC (YdhE family)